MQTRRRLIAAAAIAPFASSLLACKSNAKVEPVTSEDMSLGNPQAPVTVIEYASVACPVCARFNNEVFQAFKTKYIDTGKVHYISREMLAHNPGLAAAGFLLARCAGKDNYFKVTDDIYHARDQIEASGQIRESIFAIARKYGFDREQYDACITDPAAIQAISGRTEHYVRDLGIRSTPTFVVNGKIAVGYQSLSQLDALVAEAEKSPPPKAG